MLQLERGKGSETLKLRESMEEDHAIVVYLKKLKNVFTVQYVLKELKQSLEVKMRRNLKSIVSLVAQVLKYNME